MVHCIFYLGWICKNVKKCIFVNFSQEDEDDPVVHEIPVFLSKGVDSYLLQVSHLLPILSFFCAFWGGGEGSNTPSPSHTFTRGLP
jgi:hypothetical protein